MKYDKEYKELEAKYITLQAEFDQYKKESIKWSVEDFTEYGKEEDGSYNEDIEYSITEEQAQDALYDMIAHMDCEYGVNWKTVEYYIEKWGTPIKKTT